MFLNHVFRIVSLLFLLEHSCDADFTSRYTEGVAVAIEIKEQFMQLFEECCKTTMPKQKFLANNIHSYINYPSKTTVGYSPRFTTNRKFFANMISTVAFKNILERDVQELRKDFIKKMKYCDEAVMDQNLLKEYYDREVDLSKL